MSLLRWSESYQVGHQQVDDEHRYLFSLVNDFHDAFMERQARSDLDRLLNRLVEYTERHFRHEEALMREAGYPELERHMTIHETLVEKIFQLAEKFSNRAINPTRETVAFLETWLTDHIRVEDMAFAVFVAAAQNGAARPTLPAVSPDRPDNA